MKTGCALTADVGIVCMCALRGESGAVNASSKC